MNTSRPRILACSITALFAIHSASALDVTWDITPGTIGAGDSAITGGTGAWNDSLSVTPNGNWSLDGGLNNIAWVNANNDTAVFGGAAGTVTLGNAITAGGLIFNVSGYTITGSTLTLAAPRTVTVTNAGESATISSILAGTAGLTKAGAGTLILGNNANSITGGVTVSAGKLTIGTGALNSGSIPAGNAVTLSSGTTIEFANNDSTSTSTTIGNVFSGPGTILLTGTNNGSNSQGLHALSGANGSLTATTTITANNTRLNITATSQVGGATLTNSANGQLWFNTSTATTFANPITIQGSGWGEGAGNIGSIRLNSTATLSGAITLAGNARIGTHSLTASTITGVIGETGGARSLEIGGSTVGSNIILTGANTYTGGTNVTAGSTLQLGNTVATDYGGTARIRGTVTVNSGATLLSQGFNTFGYTSAALKVNAVNLNGGTYTHAGNGDNGWGVAYTLTGGTMQSTGTGSFSFGGLTGANTSVTTLASAATSTIAGRITLRAENGNSNVNFTVADGASSTDLTVSAAIQNNGVSITKLGAGTMVLSGVNTYTGATNVNAGTLALAASGTLPSPVTVNNTGTFRVDIAGKTLAPLTANNGSTLSFVARAGATTNVTGALTLTNGATISVAPVVGGGVGNYDLATAGSIVGTGTLLTDFNVYGASRMTGSTSVAGNKLVLNVATAGANLLYNNAAATGVWDLATTANFDNAGSNDVFKQFDSVYFDDTVSSGSPKTVNLAGALAPALITVNNSTGNNYTFNAATPGAGSLFGGGSLVKTGAGSLTLGANLNYALSGDISVAGGTLDLGGKSLATVGKLAVTGGGTLSNGSLTVNAFEAEAGTVSANVAGTSGLTKTTAGTLNLTGANTFSGANTISAGTVVVGTAGTSTTANFGTGATNLTLGAALTFRRSNTMTVSNNFTGAGDLHFIGANLGSGTAANGVSEYAIGGNNSAFTGTINVSAGRVTIDSLNDIGSAALSIGANGTLYFAFAAVISNPITLTGNGYGEAVGQIGALRPGGTTFAGPITLAGNTRIGTHGSTGTITGAIGESAGSFGITFGGTTSATNIALSGTSTYTGATIIGVDATRTAAINLTGGLGATAVTVNPGSSLNGGGSIASGGSLTFAAGATNLGVNAELSNPLTVGGNLTTLGAAGQVTVNLTPGARVSPGTPLTLISFTGTTDAVAGDFTLPGAANYRSAIFNVASNAVTLDLGAKALTYTGAGGTTLNLNTTGNFIDTTSAASTFFWGDAVTFDDSATAANSAVTLAGTLSPSAVTVNNTTAVPYTFSGAGIIAGSTALTKTGNGTLNIGTANTYAGGTTISAGRVDATVNTAFGTGPITIGTSAEDTSLYLRAQADISNAITVSAAGTGLVTLGGSNNVGGAAPTSFLGTVTLNRATTISSEVAGDRLTFDGQVTGNVGTLTMTGGQRITMTNAANNFVGDIMITGAGTILQSTVGAAAEVIPNTSSVTVDTGAFFQLAAALGSPETINALNGSGTVRGFPTSALGNALTIGAANGTGSFSGAIQNANSGATALSITKIGTGTQTLSGNNTFTGNVTINDGVLNIAANGLYRTAAGAEAFTNTAVVTVNAGGTLRLKNYSYNGDGALGGLSDNAARRVLNGGTIEVTGTTHGSGQNFTVNAAGGTFRYNPATATNTLSLTGNGSTNITVNGALTLQADGNITVTESIAGTGGIIKTGGQVVTLSATNTYTGETSVNAGTLLVSGSITSAATIVNSGGTLAGTGSVGALTVNVGGTLTPGASAGILNAGNTTFNGGTFALEINSPLLGSGYDQLNVTGSVSLLASTPLTISMGYDPTDNVDSFTILKNDFGDAVNTNSGANLFTFGGNPLAEGAGFNVSGQDFTISYLGGDGNDVVVMAVPEPGTAVSILAGVGFLAGFRRRRSGLTSGN